jgi:hypothetical protein
MRGRIVAAVLLLLAAGLFAEEPAGVGGLSWGDPPPKNWKALPVKAAGAVVYAVPSSAKRVGGASFDSAEAEFGAAGLCRVEFVLNRGSGFGKLKETLDRLFGIEGVRITASPSPDSYLWQGTQTLATLHSLTEKMPAVLFLCPLPGGDPTAARARVARLVNENRLRLCGVVADQMDAALRSIDASLVEQMQSFNQFAPVPYDHSPIGTYMMTPGQNAQRSFQDLRETRDRLVQERIKLGEETKRIEAVLAQ